LWLGSLIMAIGGFLAIADKRYRIRVKDVQAAEASRDPSAPGKAAEVAG